MMTGLYTGPNTEVHKPKIYSRNNLYFRFL